MVLPLGAGILHRYSRLCNVKLDPGWEEEVLKTAIERGPEEDPARRPLIATFLHHSTSRNKFGCPRLSIDMRSEREYKRPIGAKPFHIC